MVKSKIVNLDQREESRLPTWLCIVYVQQQQQHAVDSSRQQGPPILRLPASSILAAWNPSCDCWDPLLQYYRYLSTICRS